MATDIFGAKYITPHDSLRDLAEKAMKEENLRRKEKAVKALSYYGGGQTGYLQELLEEQFADPKLMRLQPVTRNIVKSIIDRVSLVYKTAPLRQIRKTVGDGGADQTAQKIWDEIEENSRLNIVLKTVDRLTSLLKRVALKVVWRDGGIQYDIITPNILDVIVDESDILKPVAVFWAADAVNAVKLYPKSGARAAFNAGVSNPLEGGVRLALGARDCVYEFWSTEDHPVFPGMHFLFDGQGRVLANQKNEVHKNPFRDKHGKAALPLVFFADSYPLDDWFIGEAEDLINAQDAVNVLLTELQYLIKMQSFSIPVALGLDPKQELRVDPSEMLKIPNPEPGAVMGDFKFVSPDAKILELHQIISDKVKDAAADYNIAPESFNFSGTPSSGVALKIRNMALLEARQDRIQLFREYERELFDVSRMVHNTFAPADKKLPDDVYMKTDFAELHFPDDPLNEIARLEAECRVGTDSPVNFIMRKNPDLTRDEALREYLENKNIPKAIRTKDEV